ncbi:MAG: DegV family protein [Firmicutes bacterium]|nr:DegV family protein [Bacillota bacterium]
MIKITADSTADLCYLFKQKNIPVMPLCIVLDGHDCLDGIDITPELMFEAYRHKGIWPKTAAAGPDSYVEFFNSNKGENDTIIHFCISNELSLSYQNAKTAAQEVGNVFVIDSRTLSSGIGLLVLKTIDLVNQGHSVHQIIKTIEELAKFPQTSFVVSTLEFLHKGGRASGLQKFFAGVLKIRPVLQLVDGKIVAARKYKFTNYSKSVLKYVEETLLLYNTPDYSRIMITHTGVEDELIEQVKQLIKEKAPNFAEILVTRAGCSVTTHCGPGTMGILYINKPN